MTNNRARLVTNLATKLALRESLPAFSSMQVIDTQFRVLRKVPWPLSKRIAIAMALAAMPGQGIASDFASMLVGSIALGISGVLIIQALIGVTLVVKKKYTYKDPSHFIAIAVAFLLIGTITVLSEVTCLTLRDVIGLLALMYIPAAIAIFPPLLQRLKTEKISRAINATAERRKAKRVAITLSLLAFGFMSAVSLLVFITGEQSGVVDSLLLLGAPFVLAVLAYVVGLWHKPDASD